MVLGFAERHLDRCEAGDTLLVLLGAGRPQRALAAGLRNADERERFAVLARYLIGRESSDGYWLIAPMQQGHRPCLLIELGHRRGCRQTVAAVATQSGVPRLGPAAPLADAEPLIGDLFAADPHRPGLVRRQLDGLAEAFALPLNDG